VIAQTIGSCLHSQKGQGIVRGCKGPGFYPEFSGGTQR